MRRIPHPYFSGRNVLCYHTPHTNHGVLTNGDTAKDSTAGTDAGTAFDSGFLEHPVGILGTRVLVVRKGHIGSYLHIVLDGYTVPDLDSAFNGDVIADHSFILDEAMTAYMAVFTNLGLGQHYAKLPDVC